MFFNLAQDVHRNAAKRNALDLPTVHPLYDIVLSAQQQDNDKTKSTPNIHR